MQTDLNSSVMFKRLLPFFVANGIGETRSENGSSNTYLSAQLDKGYNV